jgi:hypothetical protein
MTIRLGDPQSVKLPDTPMWRERADTAVHLLAQDFARQAWSNSRQCGAWRDALEALLLRVAALPGGEKLSMEVEACVNAFANEVSDLAAQVSVEVAQRFRPDDLWREIVTGYATWPNDWGDPRPTDTPRPAVRVSKTAPSAQDS